MSPLKKSNNIAARMGRWSASHWKTAVFGWIAFVIVAVVVGAVVGTKQIDQRDANVGQAHRADQILKQAGFQADPQTEIVLVQSKTPDDRGRGVPRHGRRRGRDGAAVRPHVSRTSARRSIRPMPTRSRPTARRRWSSSTCAAPRRSPRSGSTRSPPRPARSRRHPGFFVGEAGSISSGKALNDAFNSSSRKAGERSVPLTL